MSKVFLAPYKIGSKSATALARSLNCKRTKLEKRLRRNTTIINWGNSQATPRSRFPVKVINQSEAVALAANKLTAFQQMVSEGVSVPLFTTSKQEATEWFDGGDDVTVYCRKKLSGNSGDGLVVATCEEELVNAPLYVMGMNKTHEYRVHVVDGIVIDFTKKRRRSSLDESEVSPYVKNLANGWVFCRDGIELPEQVKLESLKAVESLGLDFGAVDILYKERDDKAYVIEVNTAPGLEGTTLTKYTNAMKQLVGLD